MARETRSSSFWDIVWILIGSAVMSFGLISFTIPHKIAAGGLTGLATVLYHGVGLPVGTVVLIGNLFLVAMQFYLIGFRSAWKTVVSVIFTGICIDGVMKLVPESTLNLAGDDPILACLYGGLLTGVGVGIVFRAGGTTGGVDIVGLILNRLYRYPIGDSILIVNFLITLSAARVFGPKLALYGLLTAFFSGKVIDAVLEGMASNRSVLIISKAPDEIAWAIMEEMNRGVTAIDGRGMYSGKPTNVLLVAARRMEMPQLRSLIYEFDPDAFVIVGDARQVFGQGFVDLGEQVRREK